MTRASEHADPMNSVDEIRSRIEDQWMFDTSDVVVLLDEIDRLRRTAPRRKAMQFPQLSDVKVNDKLVADDGFTCLREGEIVTVEADDGGLFVRCCAHDEGDYGKPVDDTRDGHHYLDGQENEDGECVGLFREAV